MRDQLLALLAQYGAPVLFAAVTIASIGLPLPITLLLIVTGSLVSQGVMNVWMAIGLAGTGSVLGDLIGYAIGRWGGGALITRLGRLVGGPDKLRQAEARAREWGGTGVFLTRWLLTPLGPAVNLVSGTAGYPWARFVLWDVLGEFLGAAIYILLGRAFSDRVVELGAILGDLSWTFVALAVALVLGWRIVVYLSLGRKYPAVKSQRSPQASESRRRTSGSE
jgi:membrane protein DedA with SNARE-associated domain